MGCYLNKRFLPLTEDNLHMTGSHCNYRQTSASSSLIIVYTVLMISSVTGVLDKNHIRLKLPPRRQYSSAKYRIIFARFCRHYIAWRAIAHFSTHIFIIRKTVNRAIIGQTNTPWIIPYKIRDSHRKIAASSKDKLMNWVLVKWKEKETFPKEFRD